MTSVGLWRTDSHKYHWNGGPALPGVTSIIGKIEKPALVPWAKGVTADAALSNLDRLNTMMADDGRAVAKAWLTAHATAESDTAKDLGTKVHLAAEQLSRGAEPELPPEHMPYLWAYQRFLEEWRPDFKSLERFVCNLALGYGGTFDWLAMLDLGDGPKWTLGDNKSGKGFYAETRLQLAGLGHAEFIGMPNDPKQYALPKIEQYAVLHLRPEAYSAGYQLYQVHVNEADWQAFQGALAIYRWAEQRPPNGEPLQVKELVA